MRKRSILNLLLPLLFMISTLGTEPGLAAIPMAQEPQKTASVTVNILTRHSSTIFEEFEAEFRKSALYPASGVDFIFKASDASLWKTWIDTGDVYLAWGGGPTLFDQQIKDDLLLPIEDPDILNEIAYMQANEWDDGTIAGAPMLRNNSNNQIMWIASAIASFGFTVNTKKLNETGLPMPSTWEDLAHPLYYRDVPVISIGDATKTTSNTRIFEIIIQKFGWDLGWAIVTMMGGNSMIGGSSTEVLQAVEEETVAIATTIDFYGFEAQLQYQNCQYILPKNESIVNGDPIAFTKHDPNTEKEAAAKAFFQFVISKEGQGVLLSDGIKRMPIRMDAFDSASSTYSYVETLRDLYNATLNNIGIPFSDPLALSYENTLREYMSATTKGAHTELRAAQKTASEAWKRGNMTIGQLLTYAMEVGKPLLTEAEAVAMTDQILVDEVFRADKREEWSDAAKIKYNAVKEKVEGLQNSNTSLSEVPTESLTFINPWVNQTGIETDDNGRAPGFEASPTILAFFLMIAVPVIVRRRQNLKKK